MHQSAIRQDVVAVVGPPSVGGTAAGLLDVPCTRCQGYQTGGQVSEVASSGLPFRIREIVEDGHAACSALGNVELGIAFFTPLVAEVVVGGRDAAHQVVNEAGRSDFLGFVRWAIVGERFTVGPGRRRMLVVFSVAGGVGRRPAVGGWEPYRAVGCKKAGTVWLVEGRVSGP